MATVLSLGLSAAPAAFAAGAPKPSGNSVTPPVLTGTAKAIWDARVKAKAGGKAVSVEELTTESSETLVNPDGTLTSKSFAQAVRVKRGSSWAAIDATLHANHDGTLSPAVTPGGLTFSGGGQGPLATLTTDDGKKLAVTAPFALPKPTVSGDTATYAAVLPDVDLQITALPTGGWRDVIVVRTAAAAADPALRKLHFPISTQGLNVESDKAGNIRLKDAKGDIRFSAPTPFQWDSSRPTAAKPSGARSAFASADATADEAPGSTAEAPGEGAKVGMMSAVADGSGIDLTPDPATFGKGSGPWYLDPTVSANGPEQQSVQVQEYNPSTQYANKVSDLGTGFCGWLTGSDPCTSTGRARAYYQVQVPSAIWTQPGGAPSPPTIYDATLYTTATSASNGSAYTPMGVYSTGSIDTTTSWYNQPCGTDTSVTMQGCGLVDTTHFTGTGGVNFNILSAMQTAAGNKATSWTFGLAPADEGNRDYRHHFASNPNIVVRYDLQPSTWNMRATPTPGYASTGTYNGCSMGWIGANQNISLHQNSWSPAGFGLDNYFHIWDSYDSSYDHTFDTGTLGSYNTDAVVNVGSLSDGHQYGWNAWSTDGWLTSPIAQPNCYFKVDKTPPTVSITSTDFPATGTLNAKPAVFAGSAGTFTLNGYDPAPVNGTASGLACFRWSDNPTPVTGWKCSDASTSTTGIVQAGSSPTFSYTPPVWGTNVLYAQAQDNAGNYSQPMAYSFYAPWNPATKNLPGSLTMDGKPDLLLPDAVGNLRIMPIGVDPTSSQAAPVGLAPSDSTSGVQPTWKGVLTTHFGSLNANALDDVFAYSKATPTLTQNLYVYPNQSNGVFRTAGQITRPSSWYSTSGAVISTPPADYNANDWSRISQLVALGPLNAKFASNDYTFANAASLLTVENGNLWLFRSESINSLDDAIEVSSTGNWGNYDLFASGPANGSLTGQPILWTRNRADGSIRSYPVKVTNGALDLSALADPTKGSLIQGITLTVGDYPTVGAANDLTGLNSAPGLWALTSSQQLVDWTGITSTDSSGNTTVTGFNARTMLGDLSAVDALPLSTITNGQTPDALGIHPGTVKGGVTIGTDTVGGVANTPVTQIDGNAGSEIDVNGLQVDTTKSFSISVWAKPNAADGVVVSQDGSQTSNFMLWPRAHSGVTDWTFAMATADSSGWPYEMADQYNPAARVQLGSWARLTASYNAITGQMALYVNGALAATGMHTTTVAPAASNSLVLGRYKNGGSPSVFFNGSLSGLSVSTNSTAPAVAGGDTLNYSQTTGGDYNGDGISDLFASDASGNLYVWTGISGGTFNSRKLLTGGWNFTQTTAADFTSHGMADLMASDASGNLYLWTANASGAYSAPKLVTNGWNYSQLVSGDFRGTGHKDLIAADSSGNLYLWPGNGDGTFGSRVLLTSGWNFTQTTAADFNGDGVADLVATDSSGNLYLWTGNKGGSFSSPKLLTAGWNFSQTAAGIFTPGGHADLVARDDSTGILYRWEGNGDGTFARKVQVTSGW